MSTNRTIAWAAGVASLAATFASGPTRAGWVVRRLHPANAQSSYANDVSGNSVVGEINARAVLWTLDTGTYVELHPPGALYSRTIAVDGGQQVGEVTLDSTYGGRKVAALWSGTAGSFVNLTGSMGSGCASGVSETRQVGFRMEGMPIATMWTGSAASLIDFGHPDGGGLGEITAIDRDQQVGIWDHHAVLWNNAPDRRVDLHPANAGSSSRAFAVADGQQVGEAWTPNNEVHAALWSGSPGSWIDLNPSWGIYGSSARGVSHGVQAGTVNLRAVIWKGTPESCENLHAYLPDDFDTSRAFGVWADGNIIRVAGDGFSKLSNCNEALLWIFTTAACPADLNTDTQVDDADFVIFAAAYALTSCADPLMPPGCPADFNADGFVDDADFAFFSSAYNALFCPGTE
jgi:hypothetical protein